MDDARELVADVVRRFFAGCAPGTVLFRDLPDWAAVPLPDGPGLLAAITLYFEYRPPPAPAEPGAWRDRPPLL